MDRGTTEGTLLIELGGRTVEYRFTRRRRRTLGITVDAQGLRVAAPLRAPWREIEGFLREKERWIVRKLDEWARMPRGERLLGESGELVSVFGSPHVLELRQGRRHVEARDGRIVITVGKRSRPVDALVGWLKHQALDAFRPRVAHYAAQLGVAAPPVSLSNARTQWGVCTEEGTIRLCWRLVHLPPGLTDYVIAHEVAHLVEMNHSRRFWALLARLYPQWRSAREQLELAAATLPILKGQR
jgi:predicted metal-dependent hydrolase